MKILIISLLCAFLLTGCYIVAPGGEIPTHTEPIPLSERRTTTTTTAEPTSTPTPAPTVTPTPEPSNTPSVGETATYRDFDVTIVSVELSYGNEPWVPTEGRVFVIADVHGKNNSNVNVDFYHQKFKIQINGGVLIDTTLFPMLDAGADSLDSVTLRSGGEISGIIGFEVPEGSTIDYVLFYRNMFDDNPVLEFEVNLDG